MRLHAGLFRVLIYSVALLTFGTGSSDAQTLEEALGAGQTDFREESQEVKTLWDSMLEAMAAGDLSESETRLTEFSRMKNEVEPYKRTFATLGLEILKPSSARMAPARTNSEGEAIKIDINDLNEKIENTEKEKALLREKARNSVGGKLDIVAGLLGNNTNSGQTLQSVGRATDSDVEGKLQDCEIRLAELKQKLAAKENDLRTLKYADAVEAKTREQKGNEAEAAVRIRVVSFLQDLHLGARHRAVLALSNLWITKRGADEEISRIAQNAQDLLKTEARALQIAEAALKPARELIAENKLWTAKEEVARSIQMIKSRVDDPVLLSMIDKEMKRGMSDIELQTAKAMKRRDTILELASRDPEKGLQGFEEFRSTYVDYPDFAQDNFKIDDMRMARAMKKRDTIIDSASLDPDKAMQQLDEFKNTQGNYPDYESDRLKIETIRSEFAYRKYAAEIAAIEEVISNDPVEAREMIKRLLANSPNEASVLKSRITKLNSSIFEREIALIREDIDEAQGYLTKFNATYAADLKAGKRPQVNFVESLTIGVENLVRARSLQAGAIKRVEILMNEPNDNVTKSKLAGLHETARSALLEMDRTMKDRDTNRLVTVIVAVGLCVMALIILIAGYFWFRKVPARA